VPHVKAGCVGLTAILIATATCTLIYPQGELVGGGAGGPLAHDGSAETDGGGAAGSQAGSGGMDAGGGCVHAAPPDRLQSAPSGGELDLWFAVRRLWLSQPDGGGPVGFDLDGRCTCQGEGPGCAVPCWAGQHCDGPEGRDNAGASLLAQLGTMNPELGEVGWNSGLVAGSWNTLLRVRNYNGQPDDAEVELSWYMCTSYSQANGGETPHFDGTDLFPLSSANFEADAGQDKDHPKVNDPQAYVSGGVLVARFPAGVIQTNAAIQIALTGARVSASLQKAATGWLLSDGSIAGAWQLKDVFTQLGYIAVNDKGLCKAGPGTTYWFAKTAVCGYVDLHHAPGQPAEPCDSLSFGVGFEAVPAGPGPIVSPKLPPYLCTKGGANDPATDSCADLCDGG
jgi:hypothetical protein